MRIYHVTRKHCATRVLIDNDWPPDVRASVPFSLVTSFRDGHVIRHIKVVLDEMPDRIQYMDLSIPEAKHLIKGLECVVRKADNEKPNQ